MTRCFLHGKYRGARPLFPLAFNNGTDFLFWALSSYVFRHGSLGC